MGSWSARRCLWVACLSAAGAAWCAAAEMAVTLEPSVSSPAPVGTVVTWWAGVADSGAAKLWYRYRARRIGSDFQLIRDYGPESALDWTASDREGRYEVEASVRNLDTGETGVTSAVYEMVSRASGNTPVISPTGHPLVFLYSAPPCPAESRMRVQFQSPEGLVQYTPYKPCRPGLSMNFYLAGMRPRASYSVKHTVDTGFQFVAGPELSLTTSDATPPAGTYTLVQPPRQPVVNGVLLQGVLAGGAVATDLDGTLLWSYSGGISTFTRAEPGGFFFGIGEDSTTDPSHQFVREFDLAGLTVQETNAARVSEQLVAMGMRPITAFHHEARRLPHGKMLVLAATEQIMTGVQGPGDVDVLGDMVLVLDRNLNVVWAWDAFDHLDPTRLAVLKETCTPTGGGCPPFYLASQANDWLHGNSAQLTPDGNILYSSRHQDWLIKIDYSNGEGSGHVLWRLGKGGDFQISSSDPWPWFSHQHDAQFDLEDPSVLRLFDNGNTRYAADNTAHSRGQALRVDEGNRVVKFILNADLGAYSYALGTAQALSNGDYHFNLGILPDRTSESVEVDSSGNIVYAVKIGTPEYRSFRMRDLYTP